MELTTWLLFVITFSSVLILPGPNSAFAVGQSLKYGFWGSIFVPLGFMSATGLHAILVFSGLGLAIQKYQMLLSIFKWLGVIYLLFLAYKPFTKNTIKVSVVSQDTPKLQMYLSAMLVSLTNPKALFASLMLYPFFLNQEQALSQQVVVLSLTAMAIALVVYSSYSAVAHSMRKQLSSTKFANKLMGSLYLGAAGALASK